MIADNRESMTNQALTVDKLIGTPQTIIITRHLSA